MPVFLTLLRWKTKVHFVSLCSVWEAPLREKNGRNCKKNGQLCGDTDTDN